MADRTLEVRVVRITGGVTTVVGKVSGGQIQVNWLLNETPGAGTHEYRIQIRDPTSLLTGSINGRTMVVMRAKR